MNLEVIKIPVKCSIKRSFNKLKEVREDTLENKIKYGIPVLPILNDEKVIVEIKENKVKQEKYISLTFDGENVDNTDELLDVLAKNHVRATFFVYGENMNIAEIKKISSYGHEIGIHGYNKVPFTKKDIYTIKEEINYTYQVLEDEGINVSRIVRPPHNKLNETIKESIRTPLVLSNIDIKENDISKVVPGSIIRMKKSNLELIEEVINSLKEQDYEIVTISEMNRNYSNELIPGRVYAKIKTTA